MRVTRSKGGFEKGETFDELRFARRARYGFSVDAYTRIGVRPCVGTRGGSTLALSIR